MHCCPSSTIALRPSIKTPLNRCNVGNCLILGKSQKAKVATWESNRKRVLAGNQVPRETELCLFKYCLPPCWPEWLYEGRFETHKVTFTLDLHAGYSQLIVNSQLSEMSTLCALPPYLAILVILILPPLPKSCQCQGFVRAYYGNPSLIDKLILLTLYLPCRLCVNDTGST